MPKPRKLGKRYDSFIDKIEDYHTRSLLWNSKHSETGSAGGFDSEYNALTKARSDIKSKISEQLDAAIYFSSVIQWASVHNIKKRKTITDFSNYSLKDEFVKLENSQKMSDYLKNFRRDDVVGQKLANDQIDFVMNIFNETRISKILDIIFYPAYYVAHPEPEEEYRFNISFLILKKASEYIKDYYLLHQESKFLENEFDKALQIVNLIKLLKSGESMFADVAYEPK